MKISFVKGDATQPIGDGNKIITHIVNDLGLWGAGFVLAVSKKWNEPEESYRALKPEERILGNVQFVKVEDDITIANMFGQKGVRSETNTRPINYTAVKQSLKKVSDYAIETNATIHMPRIGCGLAGGDWFLIEKLIHEVVKADVTVYDFE